MSGSATIWLVGMMGAGKSTVGPLLAEWLGFPFVDLDAEIEAQAGMPIPEIFEREGEAGFRRREQQGIEALGGAATVVALGGGAIAQPGVAERLTATGTVVYLRATPEDLLSRVGEGGGRPLLEGLNRAQRLERLRMLLEARESAYRSASIQVDAGAGASAEVVARRVLDALRALEEGGDG